MVYRKFGREFPDFFLTEKCPCTFHKSISPLNGTFYVLLRAFFLEIAQFRERKEPNL
jgi:hypothetical protein